MLKHLEGKGNQRLLLTYKIKNQKNLCSLGEKKSYLRIISEKKTQNNNIDTFDYAKNT